MSRSAPAGRARPDAAGTNGARPVTAALAVTPPVRRRPSWTIAGVALIGLAMLLGAWVFAAHTTTEPVLVAARDIAPGEVVDSADLRVVEVSGASALRALRPTDQQGVVGRAALGPIPAATLLNDAMFVARAEAVPSGAVVVGVSLDAGAVPSPRLAAGDRVEVLAVARTTAGGPDGAPAATVTVVTQGTVWSVAPVTVGGSSSGKTWVSLLVPRETHAAVAQAAADGRLRLGLVGGAP